MSSQEPDSSAPWSSTSGTGVKRAAHARRAASAPRSIPLSAGDHFTKRLVADPISSNVRPPSWLRQTGRATWPVAARATASGSSIERRGGPAGTVPACQAGTVAPVAKAPATEVQVGERTVRISNPDRVYFPATGATKLDLVDYYLAVGPGIVNALRERPCMMHRFPTGVSGEKVHQKRVPAGAPPWLETVRVHFPRYGLHADELCVTELADVIWAVQMSTVEFHPWNSRRADVEKPDEWRIDLDPMPDCPLATVRRVADVVHEVLDELGAVGWPKTSGGKGMHVYVRIEPSYGFTDVRRAALAFAREVERRAPDRRDDDVVAQGPRSAAAVRRLQPERPRPHDGGGLLGAGLARRHGVDADHVGRGRRRRARRLHDGDRAGAGSPSVGDLHAGIDQAVFAIDELLEWADARRARRCRRRRYRRRGLSGATRWCGCGRRSGCRRP